MVSLSLRIIGLGFLYPRGTYTLAPGRLPISGALPNWMQVVRSPTKKYYLGIAALAAVFLGFWLISDIVATIRRQGQSGRGNDPRPYVQFDRPNLPSKAPWRHDSRRAPDIDELLFGLPGERIVRFDNEKDYRAFLDRVGDSKIRLLGRLDDLRAARIGFDQRGDLDGLLDDESFPNFRVSIPDLPQVGAQPGAIGFGRTTLEWLGISGDNSDWGEGVRIAMLDTGVGQHETLGDRIREIDLVPGNESFATEIHGHGTAVAALMVGRDGVSQGIVPAANLLSIRIADQSGSSNSFLLAEGIVRAVDEGAQIINISMASYGDSLLVQDAVAYATEKQVLIVASAGNEGYTVPAYPAAYDDVIAVGAVDAAGQHLAFSNTGESIDVVAPGFEVLAAWPGEEYTSFTGTSAAAPLVAGALGAALTETESGQLLPLQAQAILESNLNASGAPGHDPLYGGGTLDVDRMVNAYTEGRFDLAVASNWYEEPGPDEVVGTLQVTVQNQGTEPMSGATIDVIINDDIFSMTLPLLREGASHVVSLPVSEPEEGQQIGVRSTINLNGNEDRDPGNNILNGNIGLITEQPTVVDENPESD